MKAGSWGLQTGPALKKPELGFYATACLIESSQAVPYSAAVNPITFGRGAFLLAIVTAGAVFLAALIRQPPPPLPVLGQLEAFELTDQRGAPFTAKELDGRVSIVNLIFTRCPTVCPVVTLKMRNLGRELPTDGVQMVSFTVDPDFDSPKQLARFAERHRADRSDWFFVTGDPEQLEQRIQSSLKIGLERRGNSAAGVPNIVHGTHFVLVDQERRIRGYYDSADPDRLQTLVEDVQRLIEDD